MFKVGDVCVWQNLRKAVECNGQETLVIALYGDGVHTHKNPECVWRVRDPDGKIFGAKPGQLRLKRPPADYDGNQAGSWDLIPWQPKKERA
jgi:hypothetical protein